KEGHVKILDFGLAHLRHASLSPVAVSAPTMPWETTPGLILGTVPYMSPEQLRAHDVDWRSDIFTLGVVLYEMLSGQRPFRGDSVADTMGAILKEDPADFPHTSPLIPAVLDRLIRRCLEKDPGERFQSARDLAFALEAIAGTSTSSGAAPPLDVRVPARVKHQSMWAAAGVVVGLIIGVTPQFVAWLQPAAAPSPVRLNAVVPGNDILDLRQTQGAIALSPDGQT